MFSAKQVANETWNSKTVLAATTSTTLSALLSPLRSGARYEVRVLVIDEDGNHREHGASTTHFQTACGAPAFPPQNVKIDNSSTSAIVIKWTNPPSESWNCWSVNVVLEVDGVPNEFNLTESVTTAHDLFRIPVTPYTKVNIRLRLRTPDNKYSAWTKNVAVVSAPEVPVEPMVVAVANQTVTVLLRPVDSMEGAITAYYLVVVREGSSIPTPVRLVNYSTAEEMRLRHYVAAHLNPRQLKDTPTFVVGDGSAVGGFENPPLTDATPYRFGLLAETKFSGVSGALTGNSWQGRLYSASGISVQHRDWYGSSPHDNK
ncbi:hypothetical protein V5799_004907 [Amblyomma americanum]|uniref:Fibronectin type-III domain-containing protein n=1 Tax=Amblyomma americanum TaxID=6943 RepID=A0AAQ4D4S1_AMBAM